MPTAARAKKIGAESPEPDLATQVAQHGSEMPVPDWARLLRCTECGQPDADFVVTGQRR